MGWDDQRERESYVNRVQPAYPVIHATNVNQRLQENRAKARVEEALGGVVTIGGGAWAVYSVMVQGADPWQLQFNPPGPAAVCIMGVLIWLHARWRRASPKN
jgi:hypothetical protein